jgi:hypothetical protein
MPIQITPDRSAEIMQSAWDARDRKQLQQAEMAQKEKDRALQNRLLQLQIDERNDKLNTQRQIGDVYKNNPQSETISTPGIKSIDNLSDYSTQMGISPVQGNPEFAQPSTLKQDVPLWKQNEQLAAKFSLMPGGETLAKQHWEMAKELKHVDGSNSYVWNAWDKSGGSEERAKEILKTMGASDEQINNIDFAGAGVGVMGVKSLGIGMTREGKSVSLTKKGTDTPHTIKKVSADGKYEQTYQYNPSSNKDDKYDIPIGERHPVTKQVLSIDSENKKKEGFGTWTPEAKKQEFTEFMITGQQPVNTRGLAGEDRKLFAKEYAQWKVDNKYTPQDVALMKTDYKAGDMSLKNMTKQEAPMSAFVLNINQQIAKVEELYKLNDRVGLRLIDRPVRELRVIARGSGDEAVKASYLLEISNEIGKLSSGASASVQQLSDSAKEDWKKVHDPNLSFKEIMKVVNATRDQANMRMTTWREAKQEVRKNIQSLAVKNSEYEPFDIALPAGIKPEDIIKELEKRRKKK